MCSLGSVCKQFVSFIYLHYNHAQQKRINQLAFDTKRWLVSRLLYWYKKSVKTYTCLVLVKLWPFWKCSVKANWTTVSSYGILTLSPQHWLSSAQFIFCFNSQSAAVSLKISENVEWASNNLHLGDTPSYSASHPDPRSWHMARWLCLADWQWTLNPLCTNIVSYANSLNPDGTLFRVSPGSKLFDTRKRIHKPWAT